MKAQLIEIKLTPLQIHLGRYSDKYMNKARLDAIYWRIKCYECGELVFQYDPDNHNYMICRCGIKKRMPINIARFTPNWANEQRRKDGFNYLFQSSCQTTKVSEDAK